MKQHKFFLDTEFIEGSQTIYQWGLKTDTWLRIAAIGFILLGIYIFFTFNMLLSLYFLFPALILFGISFPKTPETIDLISIGIISEDGRKFYAISKDFNLKDAWNRYDIKISGSFDGEQKKKKIYWIRENVLRAIFNEFKERYNSRQPYVAMIEDFNYSNMSKIIKYFGLSNTTIAEQIKEFIYDVEVWGGDPAVYEHEVRTTIKEGISFYSYYGDYDWVVFCWLFGKMINLPDGFPMYCIDVKQILDEKALELKESTLETKKHTLKDAINSIKAKKEYPKQKHEHNALADAVWILQLYKFLKNY